MATYTLTFSSDVDVTVDDVTVTSPYTLTKSCTINVSTMVNPNSNYYISMNGTEVLSETVNFTDQDLDIYANTSSTGRTLKLNAVVNFTISAVPKVSIDVTTLSGYESLAAGTYQLGVKAKAANYQDSDLSSTVNFTKLAAPVATASDTTVTWDAITNADSYDVYVDGELYENTTGAVTYDITTTVTNGTYSGDTTITDTATITITADSGYNLPDAVTVTGASQTWNKETGTLTLTNPTGAVTVSAVCSAEVTYPIKGDLITLDSKQYRVLKIDGSVAEVLAMYDASKQEFDNSSNNNSYAGNNIDIYCNSTFYSGLSSLMKNAIVDKTFTQDSWSTFTSVPTSSHYTGKDTGGDLYYLALANATYGESITRHCYCLSLQDVLDYLDATISMGTSDTTLTGINVIQMIWNVTEPQRMKFIWLRSAVSDTSQNAFFANCLYGYLDSNYVGNTLSVRPAFQIDLSKIEWTKQ